ncbi:hypothetical protein BDN72DRAFT_246924 [Pluteus cervinus]|uniref:Uncharacterized protein n=1 Tax=Pluteus cervinus TaxID=181527 RepID=A0ACD3B667_9AGAR|nr:hypothetical protein BDN72DRAFT_246924 [Pluteus cervinus]
MSARSRALNIPEILDLIFDHFSITDEELLRPRPFKYPSSTGIDPNSDNEIELVGADGKDDRLFRESRSTLLAVALSCRRFKPPALRLLWRTMDSLDPLISLLPLIVPAARGRRSYLAAQITPETWTRFQTYQNWIHALVFSRQNTRPMVSTRNGLVFTTLSTMKRFLFPSLQILVIRALNYFTCLSTCSVIFTSPNLKYLVVGSVSSQPTFASFCALLHHTSQQPFHTVLINSNVHSTELNLITSPALRVLQVGLGQDASALASLPHLRELSLRLAGGVAVEALSLPSLKSLHLSGSMDSIIGFLTRCECHLETISIKLPNDWHPPNSPGLAPNLIFTTIIAKWEASIRHIELDCASTKRPPGTSEVWDGFLDMIRPLRTIPLLTFRILNSPFRVRTRPRIQRTSFLRRKVSAASTPRCHCNPT